MKISFLKDVDGFIRSLEIIPENNTELGHINRINTAQQKCISYSDTSIIDQKHTVEIHIVVKPNLN